MDKQHILNAAGYLFPRYKRVYDSATKAIHTFVEETSADRVIIANDVKNLANDVHTSLKNLLKKNDSK